MAGVCEVGMIEAGIRAGIGDAAEGGMGAEIERLESEV